jgi:hypothetical protein
MAGVDLIERMECLISDNKQEREVMAMAMYDANPYSILQIESPHSQSRIINALPAFYFEKFLTKYGSRLKKACVDLLPFEKIIS